MDNTVGSLTPREKSIILGSLLGDGYLRIIPGRKDAFLEINHSIKEKEYVDWKYRQLKNLVKSSPKARKGSGQRIAYRFFTRQHPELTKFYEEFYQNGKKIIPRYLVFNPLMMGVWFMDDGSRTYRTYYLNTQQFDYHSQKRLIEMLKDQYGIECSLNRDKQYYRIRIRQNSAKEFRRLIGNYIIPEMSYKLG